MPETPAPPGGLLERRFFATDGVRVQLQAAGDVREPVLLAQGPDQAAARAVVERLNEVLATL